MGDVDSDCGYLDGVEEDFGCFGAFEGDFCPLARCRQEIKWLLG